MSNASEFTPFGYLRNPAHVATSWYAASGGNLRTALDRVGVEWVYPDGRAPTRRVGFGFETLLDGLACRTRTDFDAIGLTSRYHSCSILEFEWQNDGAHVEVWFFLVGDHAVCARLSVANHAPEPTHVHISLSAWVDGNTPEPPAPHDAWLLTHTPSSHILLAGSNRGRVDAHMAPGTQLRQLYVLARGAGSEAAMAVGSEALSQAEVTFERLLAEDAAFNASCPALTGDWPAGWREGLVYDFETTRLLVQPAGGIFGDVWPSWMAAWPRVVFAEGMLDMLRLAYADPALAQRAVLSVFRDAPQPNVPCVFRGGEYNMVAADGSRCGTSPAWCLPFLSLELLYLRTLDRAWLGQVYPYACAFVEWWLEHRVDGEGWLVYKCTWESGEDGNPRLDPSSSGDADISARVRPVELQATMAHAASVLAFFAAELHASSDIPRWRAIQSAYRHRTRQLFDAQAGRFRDWLVEDTQPQPQLYWGIDPRRYSAQSLTPLLIGEPLAEAEILRHMGPPWTVWPSWITSLVESAAAAGLFVAIGVVAFETIDRVYRMTTRRHLGDQPRPLPGCAPELWPTDWRTYAGNDAYGWGATTTSLLIRHLFGFKESRETDGWCVQLTPALPDALLASRRTYGIRRLNYRGLVFDLTYTVLPGDLLDAELDLGGRKRTCSVHGNDSPDVPMYASDQPASRHRFRVRNGHPVTLRLR